MTAHKLPGAGPVNPARVLVVDDEADIRSALVDILCLEGYQAEASASGQEALDMLKRQAYEVMLLNLRMPGLDGLAVIEQTRQLAVDVSIIILTGNATLESAIIAVKTEAVVDYILKPASHQEIIRAVALTLHKRAEQSRQQQLALATSRFLETMSQEPAPAPGSTLPSPAPPSTPPARFIFVPPLTLDRHKRRVTIHGLLNKTVALSKGEAAVLSALMSQPERVLSCEALVAATWGYTMTETEAQSVIRPLISRLRQKLEPDPQKPILIYTIRGRGYRLAALKGEETIK
ncbi:MAG: response regulator transcription factor [Chloroflexota bacterium]